MRSECGDKLFGALKSWIRADNNIVSAVLFGSRARNKNATVSADNWSDIDLHIIVRSSRLLDVLDWSRLVPGSKLMMKVDLSATGGVRKKTILFHNGEVDLVVVPAYKMSFGRLCMSLGLHHRWSPARKALNSLSNVLQGGYSFFKGEQKWGKFYSDVAQQMAGFRIEDESIRRLEGPFICDLLSLLQKINRGELIAAQRILHRSLVEANIILLHESRLRRGLTSFQQARRVERLLTKKELDCIQCSSILDAQSLATAAWESFISFRMLRRDLGMPEIQQALIEMLTERYLLLVASDRS